MYTEKIIVIIIFYDDYHVTWNYAIVTLYKLKLIASKADFDVIKSKVASSISQKYNFESETPQFRFQQLTFI